MAAKPRSDEECQQALDAVAEHGSIAAAARALKLPERTFRHTVADARGRNLHPGRWRKPEVIEYPTFPDEDMPIEAIINHMEARFEKRQASYAAHTWFKVKVKEKKPIGILWYGDPHLDDAGANWRVLKLHCKLCKETDGLYGANIGDTTNNWSSRLAHLYAKQDTSISTAQKLAAWFMLESGVKWLLWLYGNHDQWGDGSAVLGQMAKRFGTQKILCHDWEARFSLVFPEGQEFRIWAAHDFPGHSMWNPMHGPLKSSKFGKDADLLICGHKHNWGTFTYENPDRGITQTLVRVRGYKFMDDYARRLGIAEQQSGCGMLTIFNPAEAKVKVFDDVEGGVEYLKWLRSKA